MISQLSETLKSIYTQQTIDAHYTQFQKWVKQQVAHLIGGKDGIQMCAVCLV